MRSNLCATQCIKQQQSGNHYQKAWHIVQPSQPPAPRFLHASHILFLINFQHPDVVLVVWRAAVGAFCDGVVFCGVVVQLLPAKRTNLILAVTVQRCLVSDIQRLHTQWALIHGVSFEIWSATLLYLVCVVR